MDIIVNNDLIIPEEQLSFSYARSGGPGGQNVNKVSSKALLTWRPVESGLLEPDALERLKKRYPSFWTNDGEFIVKSQRTRDQFKNRLDCLNKLREIILAIIVKPKRRIPTKPTLGSIKRRLEHKAKQALKKRNRSEKWD